MVFWFKMNGCTFYSSFGILTRLFFHIVDRLHAHRPGAEAGYIESVSCELNLGLFFYGYLVVCS